MAETMTDLRYEPRERAYALLHSQFIGVMAGIDDDVAGMSTLASLLHHSFGNLWTGFYRVVAPRLLRVGPYQGTLGCLEIEFGRVARIRSQLAPLIELFGAELSQALLEQSAPPPSGREKDAERLVALAGEITAAVERINALGCLVKDLEAGLVDFYAMLEGEAVFLCWQFGEPAVSHWHPLDEGFSGRKPLEGVTIEPPAFMN